MASELLDQVFSASLTGINKKVDALVAEVQRLYQTKMDVGEEERAVRPAELALALDTSQSSVSRWLRPAIESGLVELVSETAKGRIKSVKPAVGNKQTSSGLPSIEELAEAFPDLASGFKAVHPVTGEELTLEKAATVRENILELEL